MFTNTAIYFLDALMTYIQLGRRSCRMHPLMELIDKEASDQSKTKNHDDYRDTQLILSIQRHRLQFSHICESTKKLL